MERSLHAVVAVVAVVLLASTSEPPDPLPRRVSASEVHECCDVAYGSVVAPNGRRLRTIVTRPRGKPGRLPAILFTAWLSCDSVELRPGATDGWSRFQRSLIGETGALVMRVDKPGCGDSEGVCAETDYETEVAGYRAALEQLLARDDVDPGAVAIVGGSMGGATAPLLAQGRKLRAVAVWGAFARTWFEHMLDLERRRLALSGDPPAVVNEKMRGYEEFHSLFLIRGLLPREVLARSPHLAPLWYDQPEHMYGRPAAFFHQAQALNLVAAWEKVDAPVLAVHGDYDWIMSRADHELIAEVVNRVRPGTARFVEVPKTDHHFMEYDTPEKAFREEGGRYTGEATRVIVDWVKARLAESPTDSFRATIQPILAQRCTPCHFPGGTLYGRIPFDDAEAVRSHAAGVLRRLKGADRDTVAAWLGGR